MIMDPSVHHMPQSIQNAMLWRCQQSALGCNLIAALTLEGQASVLIGPLRQCGRPASSMFEKVDSS